MTTLADASLTDVERRALDAAVAALEREFGEHLRAVWLYGSRARGEPTHEESDVDLLVLLDRSNWQEKGRAFHSVHRAAEEVGAAPSFFSIQTYDVDWLARRREIKSFFIQEVDRDKIVLFGEP